MLHLPSSSQLTCRARQTLPCCNNPLDSQSITSVIIIMVHTPADASPPLLGTAVHQQVPPAPTKGSKDIKGVKIKYSTSYPLQLPLLPAGGAMASGGCRAHVRERPFQLALGSLGSHSPKPRLPLAHQYPSIQSQNRTAGCAEGRILCLCPCHWLSSAL